MKLRYDPQADAAYMTLSDGPVVESEEVRPGVILDFDADQRVVGVEILHARRDRPDVDVSKLELESA